MNFLKSFGIFSFFTLLSRIFGLVRDIVNARMLGANEFSDAFFAAFRLPSLFRSLFAEGAMNVAFIPIFNKNFDCPKKQQNFTNKIFTILAFWLVLFCIIAYFFMPQIFWILAPGFAKRDIETFDLGIKLARIMFPFLFFISITALLGSILQTKHRFFPSAAYPIIMNCILIAASFIPQYPVFLSLSWGVLVAGFVQMIFLYICAIYYKIEIPKINLKFWEKDFFDPEIKIFFKKFLPAILTTCITRIGITIDTIFASMTIGAISFIYYADRLYQMPLSLIGTTISVVILPSLSKALKNQNTSEIHQAQQKIFEFALILILPATIGLSLMSKSICKLLFGAKFGLESLNNTSLFLSLIALSLPFNVLNNIFNSIFCAHGKVSKITQFAFFSLLTNVILNAILFQLINFYSVAIATCAGSILNIVLLFRYSIKHQFIQIESHIFNKFKKIIILNLLIIILIIIGNFIYNKYINDFSLLASIFIITQITIIIVLYFISLYLMKYRISYFKKLIFDKPNET